MSIFDRLDEASLDHAWLLPTLVVFITAVICGVLFLAGAL